MKNKMIDNNNDPVLQALQAVSDPIRLNILTCLLLDGEKRITSEKYNIVKSTLSHHIKLLKDAQLIQEIKTGTTKTYVLNQEYIQRELPGLIELIRFRAGKSNK
ncbi:transcriptional regulator [Enterococcus ureasiticus]|uniref:Transcriptional regulator n=2 Tax=Enterococcus ureasiticus TaxID=903984 RepID=A0A1E5GGV5_9ENTE|nr:transcriptional regulator [Enterococcus ureasiticus]